MIKLNSSPIMVCRECCGQNIYEERMIRTDVNSRVVEENCLIFYYCDDCDEECKIVTEEAFLKTMISNSKLGDYSWTTKKL